MVDADAMTVNGSAGEPAAIAPVFVVGMPRSGTTLLSSLLDAHPSISIAPEIHYFTQHWPRCEAAFQPGGSGAHRLVDALLETPEFNDLAFDESDRLAVHDLVPSTGAGHAEVYLAFLRVYAARHAKSVLGEKTPAYLLRVPTLSSLFPAARFLCIVRDPRDVSLSWRTAGWRGTAAYHALVWRHFYRTALQHRADLGEAFLMIRYEDLLTDPAGVLTRCCRHAGVEFEPGMLAFHERGRRNFDPVREPWKAKATKPLDASNSGRWRAGLTPEQTATVEWLAGEEMTDAGYALSGIGRAPLLRPRAALRLGRDLVLVHRARHDRGGPLAWLGSGAG
jgi:hypothetical protein